MKRLTYLLLGLTAAASMCMGEEVVFFRSSEGGTDAWKTSNAILKEKGGLLQITENNRYGPHGNIFSSQRLPFISEARIMLDIAEVVAGEYTLQMSCYQGDAMLRSVDLVSGASQTGEKILKLSSFRTPPGTDSIILKLWVVGTEGATTILRDLRYSAELHTESALIDDRFDDPAAWETDGVTLSATDGRALIKLNKGVEAGSLLHNSTHPRKGNELVLMKISEINKGAVTLQAVAFGGRGNYLRPIDIIKNMNPGWHGLMTRDVTWPEGTASCRFKLVVSGGRKTRIVPDRLLAVAP